MSDIKDKIQKVLEIAKRGGTEAEAATALSLAHELLAKHNLSMSDVQREESNEEDVVEFRAQGESNRQWQGIVWMSVSKLYFCQMYASSYALPSGKTGKSYVVVGRESNVETVKEVAGYLVALCKSLIEKESLADTLWKNSFKNGFASRIYDRCEETRAQSVTKIESNGSLLPIVALYELTKKENYDFLAAKGIKLRSGGSSRITFRSKEGYNAGKAAANSASLSRSSTLKIGH